MAQVIASEIFNPYQNNSVKWNDLKKIKVHSNLLGLSFMFLKEHLLYNQGLCTGHHVQSQKKAVLFQRII
jgi:hypothetical protein